MIKEKSLQFENKIYEFIKKHIIGIGFIIITIFALAIRYYFMRYQTWDYIGFLSQWFEKIKAEGGIYALKSSIGDYNCIYLTILAILTYIPINSLYTIKLVSIVFDFILAFSSVKLVDKFLKKTKHKSLIKLLTYALVLFTPTVLLNSSCWAQCDSIYASFIIISLIFLIDEKYFWSFVFLGISFAFKLQFIFILPLYILIWISKRKFPIYYFAILPIMNFITCIPSIIVGKPIKECFSIYVNQIQSYPELTSKNFPNMYSLCCKLTEKSEAMTIDYINIGRIGIIIAIALLAIIAFIIIYKKTNISKQMMIKIGIWSIVVVTFFMPNMHDRYSFVADILSILAIMIFKTKKSILYAFILNLTSLSTYVRYLFTTEFINMKFASILQLIVVICLTYDIFRELIIDENNMNEYNKELKE